MVAMVTNTMATIVNMATMVAMVIPYVNNAVKFFVLEDIKLYLKLFVERCLIVFRKIPRTRAIYIYINHLEMDQETFSGLTWVYIRSTYLKSVSLIGPF